MGAETDLLPLAIRMGRARMTSSPPESPEGRYHPVILFPEAPVVLDLSSPDPAPHPHRYTVGRYNEVRGIYTQSLFEGRRTLHIGLDLGAPVGTPVHAFTDCTLHAFGINGADGDYGPTLVTQQQVGQETLWALFGHLSLESLRGKTIGMHIRRGEVLGWLGDEQENGGWPPHVHFQLSRTAPLGHDMPGVVCISERTEALHQYPDPQIVLGSYT